MKINILILFLSTVALCGAAADDKLVTIDGQYSIMPQAASEPALLAQGLGSLVVDPIKFAYLKVTGKIESIQLAVAGDVLRVVAIDSAGARVLRESVPVVRNEDGKKNSFTLHREWISGDEWGSSKGTTVTKLSRQEDGTLFVAVSTISSGRTFIFPRSKSKADSWLKYAPVRSTGTPVEPSAPPKEEG